MSITNLGTLSLAVAVPGAAAGVAAGLAGLNLALPDIEARLAALAGFTATPGDFAADLAIANSIVASITAGMTAGLSPPSIGAQIAIIAALVATLEAAVLAVSAELDVVLDLQTLLGTGGVFAYAYAGQADALGAALTTELASGFPGGSGADATNALILATSTSATWEAMSSLFKMTP